jgi:putative DNA primase/helicase
MMQPDEPMPHDAGSNVVALSSAKRARKAKPAASERTELDLSEMLVERFGDVLRYCSALGGWHAWDGSRWAPDERERARECVKAIARDLAGEAAALLDEDVFRAAKRAGSAGGVDAILSLARSTPGIVFGPEDANRDPWLLNAANGTIDLRSGTLRPHNRDDLITRVCPVEYDPRADAPVFAAFLERVQPDPDVRAYLARLFGYAAIGVVREHVLGVLWGPGANGKSVLADVVAHVLGDYAKPGPASLIIGGGRHEPHPTDVASCVGSRLVVLHETQRGASFDASRVKLLTGGDRLTARHMHEDYFGFAPSHTLLMLSNYKPQADASDAALWRRIHLVLFPVTIPEDERDPELAEKVKAEGAGVLRWIVDGAREWQRVGLAAPQAIREQTAAYRSSEDVVGAFLDERTVRLAGTSVKAGALYAAFKSWCEDQGTRAVRGNDFAAELVGRGFRREERSAGRFYVGLGLRAEDAEEDRRGF